jgi:hypothetical protein
MIAPIDTQAGGDAWFRDRGAFALMFRGSRLRERITSLLRPPADSFHHIPVSTKLSLPEKTGEVTPVSALAALKAMMSPRHTQHNHNASASCEPTADAWETFLFEQNTLNWREHLPLPRTAGVHPSLRSWAKSQARNKRDPNYLLDERLSTPHTNGVIPPAGRSSQVRWQYLNDPIAPEFDYTGTLSEEEIARNRAASQMSIEHGQGACMNLSFEYDSARTVAANGARPTSEQVRTWEKALRDEIRWQYQDEVIQAQLTWRAAHAEALATENGTLPREVRDVARLWRRNLEKDRKTYNPPRS